MSKPSYKANLSRRDFVSIVTALLGSLMGIVLGIPVIGYLISPALRSSQSSNKKISLGHIDDYPIDKPVFFSFTSTKINGWEKTTQNHGVFILKHSQTDVKVFSNVCTHLSCRVAWHDEKQEYICPCHDAHFDINGKVISGPPPRPLDMLVVDMDTDGKIYLQMS